MKKNKNITLGQARDLILLKCDKNKYTEEEYKKKEAEIYGRKTMSCPFCRTLIEIKEEEKNSNKKKRNKFENLDI